jgi:[Skp1-protein]-hydroxyproline N-acetylglucosaminyltransferase
MSPGKCSDDSSVTVLTILCTILITVIFYQLTCMIMEGYEEYFGSSCLDFIRYEKTPQFPVKKGCIFISIASYRDKECSDTVRTIFLKSKRPEKIFLGICEQNMEDASEELCYKPIDSSKDSGPINVHSIFFDDWIKTNVSYKNFSYKEAAGPTYARYFCSKLWSGEEYFFQIDSHTFFEKDWDVNLIKMIEECRWSPTVTPEHPYGPEGSKKPILSAYPPTEEQLTITGIPVMSNGKIYDVNGLPMFLAGFWTIDPDKPIRSPKPFLAAGYMFLDASFLYDIQFDPNLSNLFQGEETLFSARLFTAGYDVFAPNIKVCSHHYSRPGPLYFNDVKNHDECRAKAETRVRFLLGLDGPSTVAADFLRDVDKYRFGSLRTLEDYWKASGIKVKVEVDGTKKLLTVEDWNDAANISEEFKGWDFYVSGYEKIKQYR